MQELYTPKQVAQAIGVSESSLKRWCDRGLIPTVRTAGGHRRMPLSGVLGFLRTTGHELVDPGVLGLPSNTGAGERSIDRAQSLMFEALVGGDELRCRRIVIDLYLAGQRMSVICDRVLAEVFDRVGAGWSCGDVEVYQERRACEICVKILHELRFALSPPPRTAPIAVGGTPEGDRYTLPTTMIELVLTEMGWRATSLGASLPFATLEAAARETTPDLFWLSASHLEDRERFRAEYTQFYELARTLGIPVVVGGRALDEELRSEIQYSTFCDRLQHLESFLATLRPAQRQTIDPQRADLFRPRDELHDPMID